MLRKIQETQNSILSELSQQKLEILEIKESQNLFQEKMAKQSKNIFQLQVYIEKLSSVVCDGKGVKTNPPEGFKTLENKKDLDDFNQRIGSDEDYKVKIYQWLDHNMMKGDMKNRMNDSRDMIFCPELFAGCNWKGGPISNPKIPLASYTNLLELFRSIGSNSLKEATEEDVVDFFKLKLRYGKDRLNLKNPKAT